MFSVISFTSFIFDYILLCHRVNAFFPFSIGAFDIIN